MGLSAEIRRQLINSFKAEQVEHVQKINQGLLALEKNPPAPEQQAILKEIFREAHSLKGAARAVGVTIIESLGHALEELLLAAKEGRLNFSPELFDLLYQALDAVELSMAQLESGQSTPPATVLELLAHLEEMARGAGEAKSRGAGETRGRGDEEQGRRGGEEARRRRAGEQGRRGAGEPRRQRARREEWGSRRGNTIIPPSLHPSIPPIFQSSTPPTFPPSHPPILHPCR